MKITIDTTIKEIQLHEDVNAEELFIALENLLPDGLWKEFKINVNVANNWNNPIVIPYTPVYPTSPNPFPLQPWASPVTIPFPNYPWITYCQNTEVNDCGITFSSLNSGVYNVEFQK